MHIGHGQVAKQCKQKQKTKKIPGDPVNWQRIRRLFFTTFLMFWWYTLSMFTSTAGLCCYSHNFSHSHVLRSTWSAYSWPDGDFLVFLFVFYFGRLCSGLTSISVSFIVTISVSVLCARSRNWWLSCFAYNHPEDRTIQFCLSRFFIHSHRLWASLCDRSSALIICWSSVSIGDTVVSALYTPQRGLLLPWRPAIAWNIHHRRIPTHRTFTAGGGGEEEGWVHTMLVFPQNPKLSAAGATSIPIALLWMIRNKEYFPGTLFYSPTGWFHLHTTRHLLFDTLFHWLPEWIVWMDLACGNEAQFVIFSLQEEESIMV